MNKVFKFALTLGIVLGLNNCVLATSNNPLFHLFPINNYDQNVDTWLNPKEADYGTKSLLGENYQAKKFSQLKAFYYGESSPWSQSNIERLLATDSQGKSISLGEISILNTFDNDKNINLPNPENHVMYGMNYRPYKTEWLNAIEKNMALDKLHSLRYYAENRAITLSPTALRMLPTRDPAFLTSTKAGEGYPFDYLQNMHLLAATPVYIVNRSVDNRWSLVISPEAIGWVKSDTLAKTPARFIEAWTKVLKNNNQQGLAGVMQNDLSIINSRGQYLFSAYVGTLLPIASKSDPSKLILLIPARDLAGNAIIETTTLAQDQVATLPMPATRENFAKLLKANQNRPYGWGGVNNYNDCSAETKGIYAMFGIFLPRDSATQLQGGKVTDLSNLSPQDRINYLLNNKAKALFTLMWLPGHIMLYMGNFPDKNGNNVIQSYQQVWGLKPKDGSWRSIIGMASFLPILLTYPEEPQAFSEIARDKFKLIDLSVAPDKPLQLTLSNMLY